MRLVANNPTAIGYAPQQEARVQAALAAERDALLLARYEAAERAERCPRCQWLPEDCSCSDELQAAADILLSGPVLPLDNVPPMR